MSKKDRFLKACRRQPVDATPIWLMRQAGRYMPEYRALRERHSLLDLIRTPELAAEVTFQPLKAFDLDAAIIFADILPILQGMGLELEFVEGRGPVIGKPVASPADIERLVVRAPEETLAFTLEAIRLVKRDLEGRLPLIGFSGAPFTLACYAIEGGGSKEFSRAKRLMYNDPPNWRRLMEKISVAVGEYLRAQADAGADALQLFDSWAGALSPADYREFAQPYSRRALQIAAGAGKPIIHFATGASAWLPLLREAGGDVIGVDWRIDLGAARQSLGPDVAVQGNLDPVLLLGPVDLMLKRAGDVLASVAGKPGHIFNLGHGVLPHTPVENVRALVDFVHQPR